MADSDTKIDMVLWDASLDIALQEHAPLDAQELIDSYLGRAGMLANTIMMGLTEPDVEIGPDVMLALGAEITERVLALDPEDTRTTTRVVRALQWATREDVTPEIALMFYSRVLPVLESCASVEAEDGTTTVIAAMNAFAARFSGRGFDEFLTVAAA